LIAVAGDAYLFFMITPNFWRDAHTIHRFLHQPI
jgi:hypothetical protein